MTPKNAICLWFDKGAEEAAAFYAATFPDSKVAADCRIKKEAKGIRLGD